jgi:hypothetical protein
LSLCGPKGSEEKVWKIVDFSGVEEDGVADWKWEGNVRIKINLKLTKQIRNPYKMPTMP